MKRDPLLWGALGAVLVVLASAEYDLARACGFGTYVAAGVPAALDIYAVRALRAKRDVLVVVVALILVNSASHLVSAGLLPVQWPLVVAVSAVAPLVLWRVHKLGEQPAGAPPAVPVDALPAPVAEPIYVAPEPAEPEQPEAATYVPILGPFVPVAELLAAPTGTTAGTGAEQPLRIPEPVAEPRPEPAEPEIGTAGTGSSSGDTEPSPEDIPPGVSAEHVVTVRQWLKTEPELTGTVIGNRLGKSDGYGRRVKRVALARA